jgi:hypothetical protein
MSIDEVLAVVMTMSEKSKSDLIVAFKLLKRNFEL